MHPLLGPLCDLEREYEQCIRHLTEGDITIIETSPQLPQRFSGPEYFKVRQAHALYAQIQARREGVKP